MTQLFKPRYLSRYSNLHVYFHVPTCEQSRAQPHVHIAVPLVPKVSVSHTVMSTLCDPMDWSPSGSSVHGILQAGIYEWAAMPLKKTVNLDWSVCWARILIGSLQETINSGYLEGRWELGGWVSEVGEKNSDYHFRLYIIHMHMVYNSVHEFLSGLWPEPSKFCWMNYNTHESFPIIYSPLHRLPCHHCSHCHCPGKTQEAFEKFHHL